LDYTKLGLFKIQKVLDKVIYRLELSDTIKIHFVFHISLLEPASRNAQQSKIQLSDKNQDDIYKIKKVLDH
jgi:hypothetical protein